jgi:hypothetical protein
MCDGIAKSNKKANPADFMMGSNPVSWVNGLRHCSLSWIPAGGFDTASPSIRRGGTRSHRFTKPALSHGNCLKRGESRQSGAVCILAAMPFTMRSCSRWSFKVRFHVSFVLKTPVVHPAYGSRA